MDLGLSGAYVAINGGSKGMGRAAAECIAAEGANVAVLARTQSVLDETVATLAAAGSPDPVGISCDLTNDASVAEAFAVIGERWGQLHALINAAGPVDVGIGGFATIDDDEWHATFDIGTLSAVRCVRHALPLLREAPWARIVNVSAHSVRRQSPEIVAYTAAKAAMTSISKNLSLSLATEGILVNTVSPGSFNSPGMRGYIMALGSERNADPDDLIDVMRIIEEDFGHPAHLGRAGDPKEIGPVITFLISRQNTYMTGADINVDGGSDF